MNLVKMLSAEEFFKAKTGGRFLKHHEYMEYAEDYADYVCAYEKKIDAAPWLKGIERVENLSPEDLLREQMELYPPDAKEKKARRDARRRGLLA